MDSKSDYLNGMKVIHVQPCREAGGGEEDDYYDDLYDRDVFYEHEDYDFYVDENYEEDSELSECVSSVQRSSESFGSSHQSFEEELTEMSPVIPNEGGEEMESGLAKDVPINEGVEIGAALVDGRSVCVEAALEDGRSCCVEAALEDVGSCCGCVCPLLRGLVNQFRNLRTSIFRLFRRKSGQYDLNGSQPKSQPVTLISVRILEEEEG